MFVQLKLVVPGLALTLAGTLGVAAEHMQVLTAQRQEAAQAHDYQVAQLLPRSPQAELQVFYSLLARRESKRACFLLAEPVRQLFAAAHGASDCVSAMDQLAAKVTDKARYEMPIYDTATAITVQGDLATVDACAVSWSTVLGGGFEAGPKLGRWQLARQHGQGYLIVGWQPCPPSTSSPTNRPSSTTRHLPPSTTSGSATARWLPSYPAGYAVVLAQAIGRGSTGACETFFTDTSRAQFASAFGAASCAEAITSLSSRVSDASNYGNPRGAIAIAGSPGHATVDACSLTWASAMTGTKAPGPQIGRLILQTQAGGVGYVIAGFRPC
ncbi:hypothetical protein JNUCC0626_32185 [Lentzea sp. JNUCC 0626]|uniref:hypothetical protein n=1 Tax=Lentzea sp. JNUCC 0626 TaxID=3367513 RepID=UPI003747D365